MTRAYVYIEISEYPPPLLLYFVSTYTWLHLIYYSIIFLFTDISDGLLLTANCDFLVFKQAGPNTVS